MRDLVRRLRSAQSLAILLDYDGTLVPFAMTPDGAAPDDELRGMLGALATRARTKVAIVSGRDRDSLGRWLGDLPVSLTAEHGFWRKAAGAREWSSTTSVRESDVAFARATLGKLASALGGRIERKRAGAAWHYRGLAIEPREVDALVEQLARAVSPLDFTVLRGACVVEVRPRGVHKGTAVRAVCEEHPEALVVAIGDDHTDEDMFRALPAGGIGVHVGGGETLASVRVADHAAVRSLLASLIDR